MADSTLYDRFKQALKWVSGTSSDDPTERRAAFGAFSASDVASWNEIDQGEPSSASDGVSVEGVDDVDIAVICDSAASEIQLRFWFYNGTDWFADSDDYSASAPAGETNITLPPLQTGTFERLAVEDRAANVANVYASPTKE